MGESTTGTGRMILKHQCRKVNELLEGNYDVEFPMYATKEIAAGKGYEERVALDGPVFKGVFQSESIIYGDSVAGSTIIDTQRGREPISSLFTQVDYVDGEKEYCRISTNLKNCSSALTYDKSNNITTYKPIVYVMRHKCSKQLYRVWITNSQWIDVTEDHSLIGYVNTKHRDKYNDILCEVKPQDIGKDINSLIYVKHKPDHNYTEQGLSQQMYELIGLVLGDGYVDNTATGGVLLSIGAKHLKDIQTTVLDRLREEGWISSWVIKPNGHDIQISSVKLRNFLRQEMYSTGVKSIPCWMETESIPNISAFLRGWFSADGFINKKDTVGLCSISEQHIQVAQELLFKCGVSSTWFTEKTENSFKGKFSGTYTKRLTVKSTSQFRKTVGFLLEDKQKRLDAYKEGLTKRSLSHLDFEIVRPVKIEKLPIINDYVYDIEVKDTHVFFANNILVHNTDSSYFKTYTDNTDDAILIANKVAEVVNSSYQEFMQNTFLCQPGFDNLVKCAREVVSDRGIFVEKKRYMLHLVDLDGKQVDKCKVMGLDTKKTTLPTAVSKKLDGFLERFLKGETWEDVSKSIVTYKDELKNSKLILDIGLPKGVKNVEDYTIRLQTELDFNTDENDEYAAKPKQQGKKLTLPGHVAASILYNQMLTLYNDKVSMPIMSGMKIKVFNLKVKYGRFTSIALPTDAEFVPDWFLENFIVDKNLHIEKLVDNPLQNILKAIDKTPPTKASLAFSDEWVF
jgi:hypothetical protein